MSDPHNRPDLNVFFKKYKNKLHHIGRLDQNTTGLLLLTNDGELTFRLTHPKYHIKKTYQVTIKGTIDTKSQKQLREGINLETGHTAPAELHLLKRKKDYSIWEISIYEGKKRQVRKMFEAINRPVMALKRIRFAFLDLEKENLQEGQWRFLTSEEVNKLKALVKL